MIIAVTGGKGGTGKSTVATGLAHVLSKSHKVLLVDADVGCPDDHLLLSAKLKREKEVTTFVPEIHKDKCIKCGQCAKACRESAIVFVEGKYPFLVPDQCIGCKACMYSCPVGAITERREAVGGIYTGGNHGIKLVTGELLSGKKDSSILVAELLEYVHSIQKNYDIVIIDTAAGTSCEVVRALMESDLALAVTEPTPFGAHDLRVILDLVEKLKVPAQVVLNKAGVAPGDGIREIADKHKTKVVAEVPYSKGFQESYSRGEPLKGKMFDELAEKLLNSGGAR
ncbi:MAG: ATP-binding protein [Candidatus Diapherotrites archaeon]|nr:ATP-binding protein [Candidatus Diapherotrites archaeon]